MPKNFHQRITKLLVERLLEGETIRDTEIKGFGVRRQLGTPSYYLHKRVKGRLRWITIGPHGSPWTPETARREAHRLLGQIVQGRDPQTERQIERAKPTVQQAVDLFMDQHGPKLKPLTRGHYQRMLRGHVIPAIGTRRLEEVMRVDVSRLHASMKDTPAAANATLAILSKFMSWAEHNDYRPEHSNPCRRIKKYRETRRERFLSSDEFSRLGDALAKVEAEGSASPFAVAAIQLLILTGARLNEILTLQWRHVDFERSLLLLPDSKTGEKAIRLSDQAMEVLASLPRLTNNPFVCPGYKDGSHIVNLQKPWRRIRAIASLDDVRIHDLRHSFASVAAASGASLQMIGALLGHTQTQTTSRYAHLANNPLQQLNQEIANSISAALVGNRVQVNKTSSDPED